MIKVSEARWRGGGSGTVAADRWHVWAFSLTGGEVRWPAGRYVELWSHPLRPACGKAPLTFPTLFLEHARQVGAQNIKNIPQIFNWYQAGGIWEPTDHHPGKSPFGPGANHQGQN